MIWYKMKNRGFIEPACFLVLALVVCLAATEILRIIIRLFGPIMLVVYIVVSIPFMISYNDPGNIVFTVPNYFTLVCASSRAAKDTVCPYCKANADKVGVYFTFRRVSIRYQCGLVITHTRHESSETAKCQIAPTNDEDVI